MGKKRMVGSAHEQIYTKQTLLILLDRTPIPWYLDFSLSAAQKMIEPWIKQYTKLGFGRGLYIYRPL